MANSNIIVTPFHMAKEYKDKMAAIAAAENNFIPLRILCPQCKKIYTLYIEDLNQGLHTLLGQACPYCKRFIREKDDPKDLLVDLKEIQEMIKPEQKR